MFCYRNTDSILVIGTEQECENARVRHGYTGWYVEKLKYTIEDAEGFFHGEFDTEQEAQEHGEKIRKSLLGWFQIVPK